jgi:hypothetical protein
LLPQCTHISAPSKTVSSVCAGSAFLYYGEAESDNWRLLQDAGWLIPAGSDVTEGVKKFFRDFSPEHLESKKKAAHTLSGKLNRDKMETFHEIAAFCGC